MPEQRAMPPRLAVMGVDRAAAGFGGPPEVEARRLLGVLRRLAPGAEALVVSGPSRVEVAMVVPASLTSTMIWHEVLFATVRSIGLTVEPNDERRLGVTIHDGNAAVRRLFRIALGVVDGMQVGPDAAEAVRFGRSIASEVGTLGAVLLKSTRMAIELAKHVELTMDDPAGDDPELDDLVESMVLAWGSWHRVLPGGDRVAELHRLVKEGAYARLGRELGRDPSHLRSLDPQTLRRLVHDDVASRRLIATA